MKRNALVIDPLLSFFRLMLQCSAVLVIILGIIGVLIDSAIDLTTNRSKQFDYPTQDEINKLLDPGNSSSGFAIFAHVSDQHVGNTTLITQNSTVLYSFISNVIKPKRIFCTGDLTRAHAFAILLTFFILPFLLSKCLVSQCTERIRMEYICQPSQRCRH